MNKEQAQLLLQNSHYGLLADLCKSGPKRNIKLKVDDLLCAADTRHACAIIVANRPEISFGLTLFGLYDSFVEAMPGEPVEGDEKSAQSYIECAERFATQLIAAIEPKDAKALASRKTREFATHFSAKLIHSSAKGSSFAANKPTALPHLSARSLAASSINIPLDQKKNDSQGVYQRLVKIMSEDPMVVQAGIPSAILNAIQEGIAEGIEHARLNEDSSVDHRLKQILVPSGDSYIALSPMGSAGISVVVGDAAETLYQQWRTFHEAKPSTPQAQPQTEKEAAPVLFKPNKLKFEIGGANPRNATIHWTHQAFQRPLYFNVPMRRKAVSTAYHFVYRGHWKPSIDSNLIKGFFAQLASMESSAALHDSVSMKAVEVLATGQLAQIARSSYTQAKAFSAALEQGLIEVDGVEEEINKDLLNRLRPKANDIPALDLFLVNGNFGQEFMSALADTITSILNRAALRLNSGFPMSTVERERTTAAILKTLSAPIQ
ncbi:MAG: hypothetical protein ACK4FF_07840 [Limnobacter sp.]|uniref:hypothetical protein n=1 Tax=Limnobacter sp. TaxID=2003368 RepID=UPI00391919BF